MKVVKHKRKTNNKAQLSGRAVIKTKIKHIKNQKVENRP
jgi:hypothetical protein